MDKIADTARLAEQEMGLSTLFPGVRLFGWYDSPSSDRKVFAPVLLLPVRLERAKSKGKRIYYLSAREGSAELNSSLQKRLEELVACCRNSKRERRRRPAPSRTTFNR